MIAELRRPSPAATWKIADHFELGCTPSQQREKPLSVRHHQRIRARQPPLPATHGLLEWL
jgi:hypothetical protein